MTVPNLPNPLASEATYKGVGIVLEHPEEAPSPFNPPAAAYHWWKAAGTDGGEVHIVTQARLEEIPNSTQDGPGAPLASVAYFIDRRLRSGALSTNETPIFAFDAEANTFQEWSVNPTALVELDRAIRTRAEFARTGEMALDEDAQIIVRDRLIAEWPDAEERAALQEMRDHPAATPEALLAQVSQVPTFMPRYGAACQEAGEAQIAEMIVHGGDRVKSLRTSVVVATDRTLGEVGRSIAAIAAHAPQRGVGQYL